MKRFIDEKGTFEIKIPATWKHSIKNSKVHTFKEYEIWKSDAFQLSINSLDTAEKKNSFQLSVKSLTIEKIGDFNFYKLPDSGDKEFTTKTWIRQLADKSVIFTLMHPNNPDKEIDSKTILEKVETVHSVLKEFKFIEDGKSIAVINSYRFDMFLQGVGATALILSKAIENKAFIEATCLIANQIDALLRIGIILKNQITNCNSEIEVEWIYQGLTDKKKSEKDIYKKALDLGILDQPAFDELYILYDDRNRVIHRFIISEITLAEVEEISYKYYKKQQAINKIIYNLESEQIKLNIGMTRVDKDKESYDNHLDYIKGKIGKQNYFDDKK
ncbi:hypothetical protein Q1W71_11850 [Flavobacterium pectinovorum]|uniref:hypothetical protein n=1 Tax=Flavobacterium pectinovorum TaxID=29533 RepID=UPI00265F0D59|nr:hypothetical protein [Flavobacterium pectinovorum]WKL50438.1 hypothetical protein Q1W71_11850 [Flavobacterium pectinovorum]